MISFDRYVRILYGDRHQRQQRQQEPLNQKEKAVCRIFHIPESLMEAAKNTKDVPDQKDKEG